ncbi:ABC transporter substrate-binding protein [Palleronia abyssalis]|uniref:Leucine-, isoleucine-, valine-, threonine-, and alanine-binding protein n=1 Tax=Palleronia abyssalis TaxID=1501240 RepID=A0A2R8BZ23_9RHOB|nr:ABC transporter substrate-binding protein [Palleronia abyssalis]SPJ25418.1 Leucine-, isoleucine-, valine-, threonine-, and alanine-binding protein [Palleronia abyssalis]
MTKHIARLAAGFALAAFAQGAAAQEGEPVKLSIALPLSGPLAFSGEVQQAGWQSAIEYINDNGGIEGRPIEAEFYDDEYKVDLGVAGFKRAASQGDLVFAAGDGTPFVRAISPENNDTYRILMSATGFASDLVDTERYKYHFLPGPTYSDMIRALFEYMVEETENPTVALVYSTTEFGRDPIENARAYAEELGVEIVLEEETKWTGVDVTSSAIKLRNAAPDYTIFHGYAGNVWPEIMKTALDYRVETTFMGTAYNSDPEMVRGVGPAADGYVGVVPYDLTMEDAEGEYATAIRDSLQDWEVKEYNGYANMGYVQSWITALVLREAIGNAIEAGEELNGDNLIAQVNALDGWDSKGIVGDVSFEDQRIPATVLYRYNVSEDDFSMTELGEE